MIEPNPYHFELMPGFYKYFHKLGYNIEIMAQPGLARDSPFINNQKPLHIYLLSPFFQKKALKQNKTQSIISLLGNARHSGTYAYFKKQLQEMAA